MNSRNQDLNLATAIVAKIKQAIKSSNDILPRAKTPIFDEKEVVRYRKQYGVNFDNLLGHLTKIHLIAATIQYIALQHPKISEITLSLAMIKYGIGEASDLASYAALELLKAGKKQNISLMTFISDSKLKPNDGCLTHTIVTYKVKTPNSNQVRELNNVSDDSLVLDPFLNVVCQANQYLNHERVKDFFKTYSYTKIESMMPFDHIDPYQVQLMEAESQHLYKEHMIDIVPTANARVETILSQVKAYQLKVQTNTALSSSPVTLFCEHHPAKATDIEIQKKGCCVIL